MEDRSSGGKQTSVGLNNTHLPANRQRAEENPVENPVETPVKNRPLREDSSPIVCYVYLMDRKTKKVHL